jgi:putative DNA primase/helicase
MTMVTVESLLREIGGEKNGNGILTAAPGHSVRDRGMRVWPDPTDPRGFKVHLFNGGDWQSAKDHVARALGTQGWRPDDRRSRPTLSMPQSQADRFRNVEIARSIHDESVPAKGTLAERYLAGRGLAVANALRFHPACPFGRERLPAMVAAMVDIHDDTFRGIHRTPLSPDGGKADIGRKMLGPSAGAVVKLSPDETVTSALAIGEGIETALSMPMLPECFGVPVWACLSAGNLAAFPVLAGVEVLWITVDNDPSGAGERAAKAVVDRWTDAGREVFTIIPHALKTDINDVVRSGING